VIRVLSRRPYAKQATDATERKQANTTARIRGDRPEDPAVARRHSRRTGTEEIVVVSFPATSVIPRHQPVTDQRDASEHHQCQEGHHRDCYDQGAPTFLCISLPLVRSDRACYPTDRGTAHALTIQASSGADLRAHGRPFRAPSARDSSPAIVTINGVWRTHATPTDSVRMRAVGRRHSRCRIGRIASARLAAGRTPASAYASC
jgi:hypothetical protein